MENAEASITRYLKLGEIRDYELYALSADSVFSNYLIIQHKLRLTGTIQGFQRRKLRGVSLLCVDIDLGIIVKHIIT